MIIAVRRNTQQSKPLNFSEKLAVNNGFEVVLDESAYNGRYFIKDGKKWIHNIGALKAQLGVRNDEELFQLNYDVHAYYNKKY